ncbi:hypothetical protein [Streptomyces sp. NPDC051310]|uniref:hypothetical protein n=1 Tax=Streptomyces sp. NPDC051310 TaxID=3365649 RepID=UPI00378755CE
MAVAMAVVAGCGGPATTHHKPGTSHQEATGSTGTLLDAEDGTGHRLRQVPPEGAPAIRLTARPDSEDGWNVHLDVRDFRFTPQSAGGAALPGRGHARLLLDGRPVARVYGPWHHLPSSALPAGARTLTARLHADDHTAWAVHGKPVEATAVLGPAGEAPADRTLDITVTAGAVQPPTRRVEVERGERLALTVTSDRDDTLHVHGYDKEAPLRAGRPTTLTLTADRAGLFEVETHASGLVLVQLAVR